MTDLADAPAEGNSTTLDTSSQSDASGAGAPKTLDPEAKPDSLRDTIASALKESSKPKEEAPADDKPAADQDDDKAKGEEKAEKGKPEEKPAKKDASQRGEDGKFAAKEPDAEADDKADAKADKGEVSDDTDDGREKQPKESRGVEKQRQQGYNYAPKNWLPDAKEKWANTPAPVRREIETTLRAHEAEVTKLREAGQRYEDIREFDELARSNGRDLKDSLAKINEIENAMQTNPIAGLNRILMEVGPRKADGQPVSLFEIAQFVTSKGQDGYQKLVAQQPQQQQQPQNDNSEVSQLRAQVEALQLQQATSVLAPFREAHPRYDELKGDIAFFLKSGKIPDDLSSNERLEAAYDMAVRINPASHVESPASAKPDPGPDRRADESLSGELSIKSAPGSVSPDLEPDRGGSIRDVLSRNMRRVGRS